MNIFRLHISALTRFRRQETLPAAPMVGFCHDGNMLGNHNDDDDEGNDEDDDFHLHSCDCI